MLQFRLHRNANEADIKRSLPAALFLRELVFAPQLKFLFQQLDVRDLLHPDSGQVLWLAQDLFLEVARLPVSLFAGVLKHLALAPSQILSLAL